MTSINLQNPAIPDIKEIVNEALEAASKAAEKHIVENPGVWYPCGFSWVRIKPARGKLITYLKEQELGRTDEFEGGYVIWNPSNNPTQWMDAKHEGSKAFAEVLKKYGFKAFAQTRID